MKRFAVYETATGRIVQMSHASAVQDVVASLSVGQSAMEVGHAVDDTSHYIFGGVPVFYPTRPTPNQTWDFQTLAWRDARTLAQHKTDKWVAIKAARDAAEVGGFVWSGSTFDSDLVSQGRIQAGVQVARDAVLALRLFPLSWTLASGGARLLSATNMIAVGGALGEALIGLHAVARAKRAQIDAATDVATVEAVTW